MNSDNNRNNSKRKKGEVVATSDQTGKVTQTSDKNDHPFVYSYVMRYNNYYQFLVSFFGKSKGRQLMKQTSGAPEAETTRSTRKKAEKLLITSLVVAMLLLLAWPTTVLLKSTLKIDAIIVEGDVPYSPEELLEASGLESGDFLPIFERSAAARAALDLLPYLAYCKVRVELPDTVVFEVSSAIPEVYTVIAGEYYIMDRSMKVLERCTVLPDSHGMIPIVIPPASNVVVGEKVVLQSEMQTDYISEFLALVTASKLNGRIDVVFFEQKFDIVFSVDGKYRVRFGSPNDISLKFTKVAQIIEETAKQSDSKGIIDVTVHNRSSFFPDNSIDPEKREEDR